MKPPSIRNIILHHCRCVDCRHWGVDSGICSQLPVVKYVPRQKSRRFWSDAGMIDPEQWHYCALYHGPQISKDIWAFPRHGGSQ